jgi:hypothetical protein
MPRANTKSWTGDGSGKVIHVLNWVHCSLLKQLLIHLRVAIDLFQEITKVHYKTIGYRAKRWRQIVLDTMKSPIQNFALLTPRR